MRKGILLLVIILALVLAIPYLDGYFFKSLFIQQMTAIANQSSDKIFKIEVEKYNLGWFSSDVKVNIVPIQKNKYFSDKFTLNYHVSHGPLAYDAVAEKYVFAYAAISGEFRLSPEVQKLFYGKEINQPWMVLQTTVNFNNVWEQTVSFPTQIIPHVGTLQITDSNSVIQFVLKNKVIQQWQANGKSGTISLQADANNLFVPDVLTQPFTFNQTSARQANGLWNSDTKISTPNIFFKWKQGDNLNINNLSMHSIRGLDNNNLYHYDYKISLEKIDIQNKFAAAFSPLAFKLDYTLSNLSPSGLNDYYNFIGKSSSVISPEQEDLLISRWANIFTPTSNMNINMLINSSLGALSIQMKYSLKPGMTVPRTIEEAKRSMFVEIDTRIAAPLLNKIIEMELTKNNPAMAKQPVIQEVKVKQIAKNTDETPIEKAAVDLLKQGKISLQLSMAVIDMAHKNIPMNEFTQNVNAGTSSETAALLVQAYQESNAPTPQVAVKNTLPTPQQLADDIQKVIDQWVQQGYLVRINNDYVSKIVYDAGILKINDKDMSAAVQSLSIPGVVGTP